MTIADELRALADKLEQQDQPKVNKAMIPKWMTLETRIDWQDDLPRPQEMIRAWQEALQTLWALRQQHGVVEVDDVTEQFRIVACADGRSIITEGKSDINPKIESVSPCYATKQDALNAISAVGKDRILACFNTLHGRW